ncbi:ubiquitin family protein [Haloechinothrix halophila]|uniref:hypothetical protein n=1 Tax=Haloechinothrix halophila TaxID=1069073 RepID=UPI000420BF4B|nr:hypothetical protein [Haloechinothrix halophila]
MTHSTEEQNEPVGNQHGTSGQGAKGAALTVTVYAPRSPQPKTFQFRRQETVGEAAHAAAEAFGYEGGNPSFATEEQVVLDRNKPLAAAHVRDGDTLELVDVGGGV